MLTYQGTHHGLVKNCGLTQESALRIEANYHELYKESDIWMQEQLDITAKAGYATSAFGLRIRTPIMAQTVLGIAATPREAQEEARTVGNALGGQSYGLLNNRAAIEFQERTLASEYRESILPIAHIHDSQYFLIKDDIDTLCWVNKNLIECMEWQDLPEIQHDQVKLGAELCVYYPTWAEETKLPNNGTREEIEIIMNKLKEPEA